MSSSHPTDVPGSESSYPVDAENATEMARQTKQARMLTKHIGFFPTQIDLSQKYAILDIGCGPGEWVLEMAQRQPMSQVTGIDISELVINYAYFAATLQQLTNAQFLVMDACKPLGFPDASFDIIHARLITGFMTTAIWPVLLAECFRLLRPGGAFCNTEFEYFGITTSAALTTYDKMIVEAARRRGQCFTPRGDQYGITAVQHHLFNSAGFQHIQQQAHSINYSTGMPAHDAMYDNIRTFMKLVQPLLVKSDLTSQKDIDILYSRTLQDMQAPDFYAIAFFQTTWGQKP